MSKAVRAIIHGRVQGVGYRAWAAATARSLGLNGWVRNLADGEVEAVFSGEDARVDEMLQRCLQGPPAARVERIEQHPAPAESGGFMTLPTV